MYKPMLLTPAAEPPVGKGWLYEPKYDGFRCLLYWSGDKPLLVSRNGKELNSQFPEIIQFCSARQQEIEPFLPLILDGELVHLLNAFKSYFSAVQLRGRMKKSDRISAHAEAFPCHYLGFDLLQLKGDSLIDLPLAKRKKQLKQLFDKLGWSRHVDPYSEQKLQLIEETADLPQLSAAIELHNGEGIIAKQAASSWSPATRTRQWLKCKNWRLVPVIITKYDEINGYFHGSVFKESELLDIVIFKHGLAEKEWQTLIALFKKNGTKSASIYNMAPAICASIACIDFDGKQLREPHFHSFLFTHEPEQCTINEAEKALRPTPASVTVTHPDKPIWPALNIHKDDYLTELLHLGDYLLPFLHNRHLTVIRYPHGADDERFFQKNCPDYAPDFVQTHQHHNISYILCNHVETLLWLGNQLALEFHVPFEPFHSAYPSEIVFDLDPPSVSEFPLAVEAALRLKAIFDQFQLQSFVKTSGGKGLQVYLPLPEETYSYEDTRRFTEFVSAFLCEQEPNWFTTERLKKKRGSKLYIDYLQHDKEKTIIAPFSPRGNTDGRIATPLDWNEVNDQLDPASFTIATIRSRLLANGNPFRFFQQAKANQPLDLILEQLTSLTPVK